ncbi:hypothetical protein [Glutamicibacter protophormiae]|uniref:Skp family chaperone for outer membrane proteins n=1 Tax=Glutamicibacter protophormiae TaxID=37930 RepID=A0ABS4XLA8_GLUPR|nr:hypothetical protein [Glutamicibacter protophormiae]MBP2397292.1 Skp family chaperone for outer membrane proteins [Glutamicibacter protophormiae]GGL80340.1 hypothetical protein GCM10010038_08000 [Glutamicibacter protophormiae]
MSTLKPLQPVPADQPETPKAKKKRWGLILGSASAIAALGGGVFWGMNIPDPKESEEYIALSDTTTAVFAERDKLSSELNELKSGLAEREGELEQQGKDLDARSTKLDERDEKLAGAEAAVAAREKAVGKIEVEQEENSVSDGIWTVGTDIKAGTYRAKEAVGSNCYWAVLKSGTNGDDIVNNGIPGGGRPTVTVRKGQDFESVRCGTWVKQ